MKLLLILICSISFHFEIAQAQGVMEPTGGPGRTGTDPKMEERLKRLSLVIRGKVPTFAEFVALAEKSKVVGMEKALEGKLDEYLLSYDFVLKYSNKVADLFRVNQTPFNYMDLLDFETYKNNPGVEVGEYSEAFSTFYLLVREIIEKNHSWSDLLNQKSYYVFFRNKPSTISNSSE